MSRSLVPAEAPRLRLPAATEPELRRWQRRFERDLHACGCTGGAVMLLATLGLLSVMQFLLGIRLGSVGFTVVLWVAATLVGALVGKALGLVAARVRRRRLYAEIERTLAGRQRRRG